jgi:c-di-GMP-binding flagellar brake protein YcgR
MDTEKREYPRLEQGIPVFYEIISKSTRKISAIYKKKGIMKNIGGGGLYFISSKLWRMTVRKLLSHSLNLNIEFYLPDFQNKINIVGEVRWEKDGKRWWNILPKRHELGVKFTSIKPEDKDAIIKYVINKQIENQLIKATSI